MKKEKLSLNGVLREAFAFAVSAEYVLISQSCVAGYNDGKRAYDVFTLKAPQQ